MYIIFRLGKSPMGPSAILREQRKSVNDCFDFNNRG